MPVDVTGALLGLAFSELFQAIKNHIEKARSFRSHFERLKKTCEDLEPLFSDMDKLDKLLDHRGEELGGFHKLLKDGKTLVEKCSRVHWFNCYARKTRADELIKLDNEMKRFIEVNLACITARDVKKISFDMKELRSAVNMLLEYLGKPSGEVVYNGVGGGVNGRYEAPDAPDFVIEMDKQYEEVKSRLLGGEGPVIVISGPGGVGKTTLAKKIFHDENIKGKFGENSFFLPASESFDPVLTIQRMCHHKKMDVSNIRTADDAFSALKELVRQIGDKPILLVLDDVWSELNTSSSSTSKPSKTERLLEKFVIHNKEDYKILVTSRSKLLSFGDPICLEPLSHKSARDLLLKAATPMSGPLRLPDDRTVNEIVRQCKGLPLALTVVGKLLREGGHPDVWRSKQREWSDDGVSILDSDSEILDCLHRSLVDFSSGSQTNDCFMDLGSFPEDHVILACALIDMWTELHNLDSDGEHAMRILRELSNRSLIDLVVSRTDGDGKNKGYENDSVMQHDLLRQLAIHESSKESVEQMKRVMMHIRGNAFPKWWIEQKEQPIYANLLSISTDGNFSSRWLDLDARSAKVVVLNFQTNIYTLPEFIQRMTELKVVIVANNGLFPAELTNFHLLGSLSGLKRIRLERIRIPFLQMENIQLNNLQKISLYFCDISREVLLPDDAMPNLLEVSVAYCKNLVILPAGLCNLKRLSKLSITNCPDLLELPQNIGDVINLEILRLNSCTKLQDLPDSIADLQKMMLLDISDCIRIGELPDQIGQLSNLEEFRMEGRLNVNELPPSVKKLRSLKKVTCHESKAELWNPYKQHLTHLDVEIVKEEISLSWLLRADKHK